MFFVNIRTAVRGMGRLKGIRALAAGLCLGVLVLPVAVLAGGDASDGHTHGNEAAPMVATAHPRVSAQSEAYELVGILRDGQLAIHLDRFATNEPVSGATIMVTVGDDEPIEATPTADATYSLASPRFAGTGQIELIFAIGAVEDGDDLLIGTLALPAKPSAVALAPSGGAAGRALEALRSVSLERNSLGSPYMLVGTALGIGLCLGLLLRGSNRLVPATGLALIAILVSTAYSLGGGDHEHGPGGHDHGGQENAGAAAGPASDTPRRQPDGSLFVPKPSQRLLEVRTIVSKPEPAQRAVNLIGRVTADPNRSGLVQSINGGRVIAPTGGLPRIGQIVRKGEVLAQIERPLPPEDRINLSEKVGEIDQLIAMAETKLARTRQLAQRNAAPESQIVDAETELKGLRRRREIVLTTRAEPEMLVAPADGAIATAKVVPGQVVQAQDVLFQIVDPQSLWVEALVYGSEVDLSSLEEATSLAPGGAPLTLKVQGVSRTLQQQATVVQFAIVDPPSTLRVGQQVTVSVKSGAPVTGIVMPRAAVVRGNNGEALVWRHAEAERFEALPVRADPFDATRLIISAGVSEGARIVTRGAELINQVR